MDPYDALAGAGSAFAHRTRLHILDILARDEACVCHLTAILGEPQAHVSQHLRVLRDAGLVLDRREGVMAYYRLADARAAVVVSLLKDLLRLSTPDAQFPPTPAGPVEGCPCPRCAAAVSSTDGRCC